jgi:NAD(P)-dependent dehydrogenase (short-subunit alcohol dehydrogenase family)
MSLQDVVVTGTSTGIGLGVTRVLTSRGTRVFGTVRRDADGARIRAELGERFVPLTMDVTDDDAVARAVDLVRGHLAGHSLGGLVNNAGLAIAGPLLEQPIEEFEQQLRVNLTGVLRVTRAFAPLLGATSAPSRTPGRIVNVSSVSGKIALPFIGGYAASKHGLEGLSEALRRELMLYGIRVIVVNPSWVVTPIHDKVEAQGNPYASSPYGHAFDALMRRLIADGRKGLPPERVAEVVWEALSVAAPRARYAVARARFLEWTLPRLLPARLVDRAFAKRFGLAPNSADPIQRR